MNRLERITAILLLLQEKACTSEEIARRFEISKRTVLRDVQALCEMGVPVIAREGAGGGYSLPEDYQLEPLPLTSHEAFLLLLALRTLNRLSDAPFALERSSLTAKLRAVLPSQELDHAEQMLSAVDVSVPQRSERAPYLETLINAVRQSGWLEISYQSAERRSNPHILPEQVYMENGLWYCRAYTDEHSEVRTYRVDRIQSTRPAGEDFHPGPRAAERPYNDESNPLVVARLTPRGVAYVDRDVYLGGLVQSNPDGSGLLSFHCPVGELAWYTRYFASLGEAVEVQSPPELIQGLHRLGHALIDRYSKPPSTNAQST